MNLRRGVAIGAGMASAAGTAYVLERAGPRRYLVVEDALARTGPTVPAGLRHHVVPMSDGGRLHAVEHGDGPTVVLVHGITLGVGIWGPQLRSLPGRVLAVSQRGHGQSLAGAEGYGFERLGTDLLEVLSALEVRDAVVVGHSMGGMVVQQLALERPADLGRHARRLVLAATSPGPVAPARLCSVASAGAARALGRAQRHGQTVLPRSVGVWAARAAFGAAPSWQDVALVRAMLDAMAPGALAGLLPHLLAFDVRPGLASVELPVDVVVGSRDVLTPPRTARGIASRVPDASLRVLRGCGHMVMLERPDALAAAIVGSDGEIGGPVRPVEPPAPAGSARNPA